MARDVKRKAEMEWVPSSFDQRKNFIDGTDPEPITFTITPMTPRTHRRMRGDIAIQGDREQGLRSPNVTKVTNEILAKHIISIENYCNGDKPIKDADTLLKHGDPEVIEELLDALPNVSILDAGDLERLRSLLDGNSAATVPLDGTAGHAKKTDSIPSETVHGSTASA